MVCIDVGGLWYETLGFFDDEVRKFYLQNLEIKLPL